MENGSVQEKSTGYIPPIKTEKGKGSLPGKSTGVKKGLPVSKSARTVEELENSTGGVSGSEILAVQILMSDFMALKAAAPQSWQVTNEGKIYWCAVLPGHILAVEDGNLLVDGKDANEIIEKLLAVK